MSKKRQKLAEQVKNGFFTTPTNLKGIGILFELQDNNQLYFQSSMKLAAFRDKFPYTDVQFYILRQAKPIQHPLAAVYDAEKMQSFSGPIIATSVATLRELLKNRNPKKYFYVYNIAELFLADEHLMDEIRDKGVVIFTRCQDYKKKLQDYFGLKVSDIMVPDTNYEKIMEIVDAR